MLCTSPFGVKQKVKEITKAFLAAPIVSLYTVVKRRQNVE
jgi:hypothetical protein